MNKKAFEKLRISLLNNPRRLFLMDGFGALMSAFLLGVVLVRFEKIFGIPAATLYFLALWPILFSVFHLYSYRRGDQKAGLFLKIIAVVNLLYCFLSIGLAIYHYQALTYLGWTYIFIEITIVTILAIFEIEIANRLRGK